MKIQSMFQKDIDRDINGVVQVSQDDQQSLKDELSEYIITKELRRHFATFFDNYVKAIDTPTDKIGVWISGFFGSGKSHFLKMLSVINRISERGAELLSTEDFLVIDALYHERPLNEKMQSRLNRLIEMGIVEHIGRKKYVLARSLYAATGKTGVHTRRVGLDRDTNKELLLKHIRQNSEVGTPFKELQQVLPGLNRNQIQDLMKELKKDGKVFCEGRTSAARWFAIN